MAAESFKCASFPEEEDGYVLDTSPESQPPPEVFQLWTEVSQRLDTRNEVVWNFAAQSLDHALQYLSICKEARSFAERYAGTLVEILSSQSSSQIGPHEIECVQESLLTGCLLVAADLKVQLNGRFHHNVPGKCHLLDSVLRHLFSLSKAFYERVDAQGAPLEEGNEHQTNPIVFPNARRENVEVFRACDGFSLLNTYLQAWLPFTSTGNPDIFPTWDTLRRVFWVLCDSLPSPSAASPSMADSSPLLLQQREVDAISICQTMMQFFSQLSDDALKSISPKMFRHVFMDLSCIFSLLVDTQRTVCKEFYAVWGSIILKLLFSSAHPLQMAGWENVNAMIEACAYHRPPPRQYVVSNAGVTFVNGTYDYAGPTTHAGYVPLDADVSYVRILPAEVSGYGGRKLTLCRCTLRSQKKRWFCSIPDMEQPGTDRDVDFYTHKSSHKAKLPPTVGWTSTGSGKSTSPPQLQPIGVLMPPGQEQSTFEHEMAAWAMKNRIVERILLSNATLDPDMQAHLHTLMQFLFDVSSRDGDFSACGLIPALCEGSQQRRANIFNDDSGAQGISLATNVLEADKVKGAVSPADDSKNDANSSRKRVAVEASASFSKQTKCHVGMDIASARDEFNASKSLGDSDNTNSTVNGSSSDDDKDRCIEKVSKDSSENSHSMEKGQLLES